MPEKSLSLTFVSLARRFTLNSVLVYEAIESWIGSLLILSRMRQRGIPFFSFLLRISFFGTWFNMERACPFSMWAFRFVDVQLYSNARFIILVHSCQTRMHNRTTSVFLHLSFLLTRYIFLILFQVNYY